MLPRPRFCFFMTIHKTVHLEATTVPWKIFICIPPWWTDHSQSKFSGVLSVFFSSIAVVNFYYKFLWLFNSFSHFCWVFVVVGGFSYRSNENKIKKKNCWSNSSSFNIIDTISLFWCVTCCRLLHFFGFSKKNHKIDFFVHLWCYIFFIFANELKSPPKRTVCGAIKHISFYIHIYREYSFSKKTPVVCLYSFDVERIPSRQLFC